MILFRLRKNCSTFLLSPTDITLKFQKLENNPLLDSIVSSKVLQYYTKNIREGEFERDYQSFFTLLHPIQISVG